jgi:hypothetical protein
VSTLHRALVPGVRIKEERGNARLRKAARARTVDTPLRLSVPSPSPVRLNQEALINMASFPEARGDERIAYVFVPRKSYDARC